jgi:hypothetical protein
MQTRNPYTDILQLMEKHGAKNNPETIQIATVLTSSPLSIQLGEIPIYHDSLLVADYLLQNYSRQVSINGGEASTMSTQDTFSPGDILAVIQLSIELVIVLAKVVSV